MPTRYGILGTGMMGQEHIRNIALLPDAEVVAFTDPDPASLATATALAPFAKIATSTEDLLATDLDALVIASPNHLHAEHLRAALATRAGILVEKPLGITTDECADLITHAAGRAAPVWVAMEYRYMPAIARLIEEVRAGRTGPVKMLTIREHRFPFLHKVGHWNRFNATSGGTLVEKCCHFFDLMRLILAAEPVRVFASGAMDVNFLDEDYAGLRPDVLDNAYVLVDFDSGARAMLELCMFAEGAPWQEEVTAVGPDARLDARMPGPGRFARGTPRLPEMQVSERATGTVSVETVEVDADILAAGDHHGSTFFQHQRFLEAVRTGAAPEVTLDDGLMAVAIGAAAEESVRTGRPVSLARAKTLA